MSVYLGDHTALCRNRFGHKMYVDTRDMSLAPHLLLDGDWERWVTDAMSPLLHRAVFVDIGANVGWYCCAAEAAKAACIYAFDPNPRMARLLSRTATINGFNWDITQSAVSDENGEVTLCYDNDFFGSGTVSAGATGTNMLTVPAKRFDDSAVGMAVQHLVSFPLVIKIDAEGVDGQVLLGAVETIRSRSPTLFVEHTNVPGNKLVEAYKMLSDFGYVVGRVHHDASIESLSYESVWETPNAEMLCFRKIRR